MQRTTAKLFIQTNKVQMHGKRLEINGISEEPYSHRVLFHHNLQFVINKQLKIIGQHTGLHAKKLCLYGYCINYRQVLY